jgi:hypothetical protein
MRIASRVAVVLAVTLAVVASLGQLALAQESSLKPSEIPKFMGTWVLSLDSPQGSFAMTFTLSDKDGKAVGELTSDIAPAQPVTDISKAGDDLILKYMGNFQGQSFDAKITLTPDGDTAVKVVFDVMQGQFVMGGVGSKK